MRILSLVLFCFVVAGCASHKELDPADVAANPTRNTPTEPLQSGPSEIETKEIVRILEQEDIDSISTSHSQKIYIRLKDGREYEGTYEHSQAGKYSTDEHFFDILNLVMHITKNRPPEEVKDWQIIME